MAIAERLWLGVPMFFVISGYCISATVDAHRRRGGGRLSSYIRRRVRRIFPPYWCVLGAAVLLVGVLDIAIPGYPLTVGSGQFLRPWWYSEWQWLGNITLTEQWRMNVIGGQKAWFLGHAWTLAYEEQFYIVAAVLLWAVPRRYFAAAALVSGVVAAVALAGAGHSWPIEGFFFDGSWLQFYLGVVVYYVLNYGGSISRRLAVCTCVSVACIVFALSADMMREEKSVSQAFFVALLFAAFLVTVHRFDARLAQFRALNPLKYAGLMCYSLYLVHLPINKLLHVALSGMGASSSPWLTIPVCAVVSIPIAWLFHVNVERRFMSASTVKAVMKPHKMPIAEPV